MTGWLFFVLLSGSLFAGQNPVNVTPSSLTQRVGDHLAFLAVPSGAQPLAWQWQFNGTNLTGQTSSSLSLTNIQIANAGTYSMLATLSSGPAPVVSATLFVSNGFLPLASTNLVVARVGDGLQSLNTTSGNTLYLDQISTNGNYVSTVMVPDSGPSALIVEGSGASVGLEGSILTLSYNQQYLNFAGYNQALPNSGVTFTGSSLPRAIGAVNGLGYYVLCLTNNGLYNGAAGQIRCAVSVDGIVNTFWTAGIVTSPNSTIKNLTSNQGNSGIPQNAAGADPRVLAISGGNLWVSSGNNNAGQTQGLYSFSGLPSGSATAVLGVSTGASSDPNDFAFSPDGLTVYIADDDNFTAASGVGGIERWDYNGSAWVFNYTLGTGTGNWGARGLAVDFTQFAGGGSTSRGAVVYATTAESSTNRLIRIADTSGSLSTVTLLAAAGPNQLFRGVRFGPKSSTSGSLQADTDDVNVTAYGAVGDGVTDDTAAFKSAISATSSGTLHSGIYVPMGKYVISGTLTLNAIEMIGNFAGGWPADTMPMPTLLMRILTAPGLSLENGASVHGIAIVYDQGSPATSNAPAISLTKTGNGFSVSSVRIQNPYDGITTPNNAQPGRSRFSDIYIVSPVHVGVQITKCYDFVQYRDIEVRCPNAMSAGAAFVFGRVDEGCYTGLFASNCLTGFEFDYDSSTNPAGGAFTGGLAGCSTAGCGTGVVVNGPHKIKITGGDFSDLSCGALLNGALEFTLVGGRWQTAGGQSVQIESATNVIIDGCMFGRPYALAAPQVTANNLTTLSVSHCQFLAGSTGLQLGAGVARAIVIGDSFEDGGVSNFMTSGMFVVGPSLNTASLPSGLVAAGGGGGVTLSWGYAVAAPPSALYMTTNLASYSSWIPVTNAVQSNNGVFSVSVPVTNSGHEFFQLGSP